MNSPPNNQIYDNSLQSNQIANYKRLIQIMLTSIQQTIKEKLRQGQIITVVQCHRIHKGVEMDELVNILKNIYRKDEYRQCQLLCLVTVKKDDVMAVHYQICDHIIRGVLKSGRFEQSPFYFKPIHLKQFRILAIYPWKTPINEVIKSLPDSHIYKTKKYENKFMQVPSVWVKPNIPHPLSCKKQEKTQPLSRKSSKSLKPSLISPSFVNNKKQNKASQYSQNNMKSIIEWAHKDSNDETDQSDEIFQLMNNPKFKQVPMVIEALPKTSKQNVSASEDDDQGSIFAKMQMAQKAASEQKLLLDIKSSNNNAIKQNLQAVKTKNFQKEISLKNWLSQK